MGIHFFLAWKELHDDMVQDKPPGIQKGAKKTSNFRSVKLANVIFCQTSWKFEAIIQRICLAVFFWWLFSHHHPLKKGLFLGTAGGCTYENRRTWKITRKGRVIWTSPIKLMEKKSTRHFEMREKPFHFVEITPFQVVSIMQRMCNLSLRCE